MLHHRATGARGHRRRQDRRRRRDGAGFERAPGVIKFKLDRVPSARLSLHRLTDTEAVMTLGRVNRWTGSRFLIFVAR